MTKDELDFINAKNVSDEKKLDIFKEAKFKELEEETNKVKITEKEKTNQVRIQEETKRIQAQEETKQKQEETNQVKITEEGKITSVKTELNFISDRDVPDEKKLDIFKEAKFKELEKETNQVRIKEEEETNKIRIQEEELTKREQEKTKQKQEDTAQVKITEEESTNRVRYTTCEQKHKNTSSLLENIILGLVDGYIEYRKDENVKNTDDTVEDIEYTN